MVSLKRANVVSREPAVNFSKVKAGPNAPGRAATSTRRVEGDLPNEQHCGSVCFGKLQ